MNFSKVAVKRPVTTLMCVCIAVAFGALSIFNLKMDLFPNMNIPIALVLTTYDGAGSEEIENLITEPLESAMGTVSGIDTITSTSSNGSSMVMLKFEDSVDIDLAAVDIREKIDLVKRALPDDADDPMVIKLDINSMASIQINATCEGMGVAELKDLMEDKVSDRLERQDGVASVTVSGGQEKEIRVIINQEKMRGYGISESSVTQLLSAENSNTPMGTVDQGDKNLTIRVKGEFTSPEEIENIPLSTSSGATVYIRDFATIEMVYKEASSAAYTNGKPSINLTIQKQSTANTVNVSNVVMEELEKIKAELPDVEFLVVTDPADYIKDAIASVANSAMQGGILAVIVLYVFLRNFKSTLVVGLSMPISIIATFALMFFAGINLNLMSLGGLTLGIGMLVDNSIVVLESIYKKIEEGQDRITSAVEGAREVGTSVVASTLTTVAVFLPISFVGGTTAQLFNDLSLTIVFSLTASLIVSITFVPMAASLLLSPESAANVHKYNNIFTKILDAVGHGISSIEVGYKVLLDKALNHKKITLLIMVGFVVFTGAVIPSMGMEFMPQSDEGAVAISIELPKGTKLEETEKIAWDVIGIVEDTPEIKDISMRVGGGSVILGSGEDSATININLVDLQDRKRSSSEVAQSLRPLVKDIAGAQINISASSSSMGSYSSSGVEVRILGDELDTLKTVSNDVAKIVQSIPGTSEVRTSMEDAAPQTTIRVDRRKASAFGISSSGVANIVKTAIAGTAPTTYKINGDEYDIRIMRDKNQMNYLGDVENILIPSSTGASVPLYEIADIITEDVPVEITRDSQQKYVSVTANLDGVELSKVNDQITQKMNDYIMPEGYEYEFGGSAEDMAESFAGLGMALIIAVFLVYMIMAAEFEAFSYPLIVMFSIPIAMTGGLFGLFVARSPITVTALLGLIMLAGVVVNNAIVLIDYSNLLVRERDIDYFQAMKIAGPTRLRPILMSTLTTVLGMLPMMISQQQGAEMMRGLATVVVFGLTLSTLVTLILIPVIYVAYNDISNRRKKRKERKKANKLDKQQKPQVQA